MEPLRTLVQQSVEMANELQDSAKSLHRQSDTLNDVVVRFKVGGESPAEFLPVADRRGAKVSPIAYNSSTIRRVRVEDRVN